MSTSNTSSEMTGKLADRMRKLGVKWIKENMFGAKWPEDDWNALGDNHEFDLNLWVDDSDPSNPIKRANVYPPSRNPKNSVDTSRWVTIDVEKVLQERIAEIAALEGSR